MAQTRVVSRDVWDYAGEACRGLWRLYKALCVILFTAWAIVQLALYGVWKEWWLF